MTKSSKDLPSVKVKVPWIDVQAHAKEQLSLLGRFKSDWRRKMEEPEPLPPIPAYHVADKKR